jgi:mevalonate kinase
MKSKNQLTTKKHEKTRNFSMVVASTDGTAYGLKSSATVPVVMFRVQV